MWKIFRKKELKYPSSFAKVRNTDIAKDSFIDDEFNKEIVFFKNGKIVKTIPYTKEDVRNIIDVLEIPVINELINNKFDFDQEEDFGEVTTRR